MARANASACSWQKAKTALSVVSCPQPLEKPSSTTVALRTPTQRPAPICASVCVAVPAPSEARNAAPTRARQPHANGSATAAAPTARSKRRSAPQQLPLERLRPRPQPSALASSANWLWSGPPVSLLLPAAGSTSPSRDSSVHPAGGYFSAVLPPSAMVPVATYAEGVALLAPDPPAREKRLRGEERGTRAIRCASGRPGALRVRDSTGASAPHIRDR
mmetsp:Transcript_24770/g.62411  ORF Transcript_24770/g.62411 Transcript_24770/m.62411 type:complete len:218 (+) Transcript_24770:1161-1814(+)